MKAVQVSRQPDGFFVTIEGIEGAGKSTLARLLGERLTSSGSRVVVTAEPGGDPVCEQIRQLLLLSSYEIASRAELLLFEAARAQHVEHVIRPALAEGAIVICDRFTDSSVAYQGWARGIDISEVRMLNDYAAAGLRPDLTILLDLTPEEGMARTGSTDRFSREGIEFHRAVRKGYLSIAQEEPDRFVIIDADQSVEVVAAAALNAINSRLCAKRSG